MRGVLALVGVAVLGFVPAGCGSDDDGAAAGTSSGGPAQTVDLTATEYAFDPSSLSVGAAGKVTFRISNDGQQTHALEVEGKGIEEETDSIGAGESDTLTIDLQPGEYEFYCPIDGHRDQGMEGTLVVGGSSAGASTGDTSTGGTGTDETETDEGSGYGG